MIHALEVAIAFACRLDLVETMGADILVSSHGSVEILHNDRPAPNFSGYKIVMVAQVMGKADWMPTSRK